jgi:hemin uptake protein HemP
MNPSPDKNESPTAPTGRSVSAQERSVVLTDNRIDSRLLFGSAREITIAHGSDIYRLRLTSQNKLILTK